MANTANTTAIRTNFNLDPWNDDFDPSKNFMRILFRPEKAVQSRELTQIQTMLQKQIDRFGKHVFRDGSIVIPGKFSIYNSESYVKVKDTDNNALAVDISEWIGRIVTGSNKEVQAYIVDAVDGVETNTNTKTIYVRYLNTGTDGTTTAFTESEVLTDSDGNTLVAVSSSATGKGCRFEITEGVVFAKEHFVTFESQSIVLSRYSQSPNCKIGFVVTENIVNYTDDQSLLDPAVSSSNYTAPGADRFQLVPTLEKYELDAEEDVDFVRLLTMRDGIIEEKLDRSQYAILRDEMAKRTFDESGDYVVQGLNVRLRENLDDGSNYGYSTTGNTQLLSVGVDPGVAYIKGYEVNKLVTSWMVTEKGLTSTNINSQIITPSIGNYLLVDEFVGAWNLDEGTEVSLYNTAQNRISTKGWSTASQTGSNIGSAKIKGLEYSSGIPGTANAQYKLYLFDISMIGSNSFSNVKSVYYNNLSTADMGADVVLTSNAAVLYETINNSLLYYVGSEAVKTIRDSSGNPDTTFTFRRSDDVSIASNGTFSVIVSTPSEQTPYGSGTLGDTDKQQLILTINENKSITLSGTVSGANGSTTLTGAATTFTNLNSGDKLEFSNVTGTFVISSITNATSIILTSALTANLSSNTVSKVYKAGDIVDLTTNGSTGVERTVTTTSSTISVDLKETFGSTVSGTLAYKVSRTSAKEAAKTLKNSRYVKINCASAGVTGPFNLGFADIYQIRSIRSDTSAFTTSSQGTDVTSLFTVDNGQRDAFYEHGSITPKSGLISLSNSNHLLVEVDYFAPDFSQGVGFFSIDSYPINDSISSNTSIRTEDVLVFTSPTSGLKYDLRNYLDFRPVKDSTAADSTTVAGATTNPSSSTAFTYEANGLRIPVPSSQVTFDYAFYLPRKDVVVVDENGNLAVIKGVPSSSPITPVVPDNVMTLATLFIPPYPSLAPNYAHVINRYDLAGVITKTSNQRSTMRDINVLKDRVVNLEYYAALNTLEKDALDLVYLDTDGLTRFKNGIFVDTFRDHSLGDINNPDYKIVVDPEEKSIRPLYTMESIPYSPVSNTNVVINNGVATLSYTEEAIITNNAATTTINNDLAAYRFVGDLFSIPENDVWVDTQYLPDNGISIGDNAEEFEGQTLSTTWNSWQTNIVGYNVYNSGGRLLGQFTPSQYSSALSLAQLNGGRIDTLSNRVRSGVETYNTVDEDNVSLGNKVVDVSIVPYIRPQIIHINGRNLKANSRYYVFFDGENMSDYVTPFVPSQNTKNVIHQTISSGSGAAAPFDVGMLDYGTDLGDEGDSLYSDTNGEVFALLRLPQEKKFRTGTREIKLTDTPSNNDDAVTYAVTSFVAQGLIQQKQDTILTTRKVIEAQRTVTQNSITSNSSIISNKWNWNMPDSGGSDGAAGMQCSAYSFLVKAPASEEGLFVTSFDIFVAEKHASLGLWCEIREMDNNGVVSKNRVPLSDVYVNNSDITTSNDGTTPLHITFRAPIFLYNNKEYALVVHSMKANPDLYLWAAKLGENDVVTNRKVTSRPYTGTFYTTNNNMDWIPIRDVDLKLVIYRAVFDTTVTGTLVMANKPVEKLKVSNSTSTFTHYGENIIGDDTITLSGITGGTIVVGDILVGNVTNSNTAVSAINGSDYSMANTGYRVGERVTAYFSANMVSRGITANVSSIIRPTGTLYKYVDSTNNVKVHLVGSNGVFETGRTIRGQLSGHRATVDEIQNFRYSVVDFEPSYLNFIKTTCAFQMQSLANTGSRGNYFSINDNENIFFSDEQAIYGRTNEVDSLSSGPSNNVKVTMTTTSSYLSPVIDFERTHSVYVDNIINANTTGENSHSGGNLINKYIMGVVTLNDGQDAEDIKIKLTAYRPPTTDVKVWVKLLNAEDSEKMNDKNWIELEKDDDTVYSSLADRNNFIEFSYGLPDSVLTSPIGAFQYVNSAGSTFTGYKYFAVKIGLIGTNSAIVPRVADLRGNNLQM